MKLYIPVESVKTENIKTNKSFKLRTDSKEELKCDDMIVLDDNALLNGIRDVMENEGLELSFVGRLIKLIAEDEGLQSVIIKKGLDLATQCTEDPEKTLFVAAKKMWATIDRY